MKRLSIFFLFLGFLAYGQQYTKSEKSRIMEGEITTPLPIFQKEDSLQHKVLLAKSIKVKPRNRYTKILVNRMKLALLSTKSGVGIAAPQVGINRNIIWVQRFDLPQKPLHYFLNPVITWKSEILNLGPEGDLSIADFRDQFYRSKVIQLKYEDLNGKKHIEIIEGFTAVIVQHEIDHLFGILISDKIKEQKNKNFQPVQTYQEVVK
ncbi:peptide deformylase [Kaistella haifensis]|uniref:Peptide deformylase-like n=1 Tax=Kaistella haifensis DSM 19056 TaxID=1450526 RepID=A0A246B7E5_9FLAO|nr:peptide deformylase [Kaistella haifensis]AZB22641.1 peptide deformylase [Kaistella haifensis]OWK97313.1 peptide deformylase [Kaistella haifensis DSM 19056]